MSRYLYNGGIAVNPVTAVGDWADPVCVNRSKYLRLCRKKRQTSQITSPTKPFRLSPGFLFHETAWQYLSHRNE